jgi:hypothetical protein
MRALGLTPRTRTLAYALVFWAEMSRSSPLLERFQNSRGGGGGGGEYVTFVRWLEEWVGVGNLPDEKEEGRGGEEGRGYETGKVWSELLWRIAAVKTCVIVFFGMIPLFEWKLTRHIQVQQQCTVQVSLQVLHLPHHKT